MVVQGLSEVQEAQYQEPTVLLVQRIGGEEDIPQVNICIQLHRALDKDSSAVLFSPASSCISGTCAYIQPPPHCMSNGGTQHK